MAKLQRLTQDELGRLFRADGSHVFKQDIELVDKIKTLVVQHPCLDISAVIDEMCERNSAFVPRDANSYVASDFNGDTQHVRKNPETNKENVFSVYAIQFIDDLYLLSRIRYQLFKEEQAKGE